MDLLIAFAFLVDLLFLVKKALKAASPLRTSTTLRFWLMLGDQLSSSSLKLPSITKRIASPTIGQQPASTAFLRREEQLHRLVFLDWEPYWLLGRDPFTLRESFLRSHYRQSVVLSLEKLPCCRSHSDHVSSLCFVLPAQNTTLWLAATLTA